jgi:[ribosomal protein S5]-alanine N-acetyltransferase
VSPAFDAAPPVLHTARLVLRALTEGDRHLWLVTARDNDAFWAPFMPQPPAGADLHARFQDTLHRAAQGWADGTAVRLAAFTNAGDLVGFVNANNIVRRAFRNTDLGWAVTHAAQGQGLAGEMVTAMITWLVDPAGGALHRVAAAIMPRNTRSLALAARIGMRREGLALRYLEINGVWEDHELWAATAEEWGTAAPRSLPAVR